MVFCQTADFNSCKKMKRFQMLKIALTIFVVTVTVFGFSQSIDKFLNGGIVVDTLNVPINPSEPYFPKEMFPIMERKSDGTRTFTGKYYESSIGWYSKFLFAAKEPLLFNRKITGKTYRFTWLRSFDPPIVIRIESDEVKHKITWKVLSGKGGYEPGELTVQSERYLTDKEWSRFMNLISLAKFWEMPSGKGLGQMDGAEWIMEGVNSEQYKVVSKWSPEKGNFYNACRYLIYLTGMTIPAEDIY